MSKGSGIKLHLPPEKPSSRAEDAEFIQEYVTDIDQRVTEIGVAKFLELAQIHWPVQGKGGEFQSFDFRNKKHLAIVLGLTYQAMRSADQ